MSDTILVGCPACGQVLNVPAVYAGKNGKCNKCGAVVQVPTDAPEPPVFQAVELSTRRGSGLSKALIYGFGGCLGVFAAMMLVGGCLMAIGGTQLRDDAARRNSGRGSSEAQRDGESFATMQKFNQIQAGMPHHQVVHIMGSPGEVMTENVFGAGTQFETATAIYTWRASNGIANMNVTMQNARVVSKAQIGLD